jgi:RHS protein
MPPTTPYGQLFFVINYSLESGKNTKNIAENRVPENPLNKANDAQKVEKGTKVADNKDIDFDKMASSDKKAVRTLKKRIEEHKIKLEEFKKNPTIREGMKNLSEETIKKQQERRILHLEREIKAFGKNIDDIVKKY